ncbi:MAG TPA: hypothetical protein VIS57_09335 [Xanthomonadales bacterium]
MANKTWLKRIAFTALAAELAYVILFNLALQLPLTRTFINQIRPDKFSITWEKAWTLYPFRFHFRDASGHGQSRSQQWEFETQAVSASIDVLPLFFKRVWIDRVRLSDTRYYQRPRLKPDKDYDGLIPFYPPISGHEIADADTTPKKTKRPWHVDIEDIRLDGEYHYWVHRLRGQARGTLRADLDVVTRGGLFSITVPQIELELDRHFSCESLELFEHGVISGGLAFAPFIPRENKGSGILRFLQIDADLAVDINNLDFIDPLISKYKHLLISGTGFINGHLHMEAGRALAGTDLSVDADNLNVNLVSHEISGNGALWIKASEEPGNRLDLDVRFNDMVVKQAGGTQPLLTGQGLVLIGTSDNTLTPAVTDDTNAEASGLKNKLLQAELELKIPPARVADMSVFNYYIPPGAPLSFTSGTAELEADISLTRETTGGFLRLQARDMQAQVDEQSIRADFSADIAVVDGTLGELTLDISGSELRLDNVKVVGDKESFNEKDWAATLTLLQAETVLSSPFRLKTDASIHMTDSRPIVAMLGNQKDRPKWVKNTLTIEDVNGTMALDFVNPRLTIPTASMDSNNIELGAKAIIDKNLRSGMIYARYKKLDIVVKIADGKKNIDLLRARRKFNEYQLPGEIK